MKKFVNDESKALLAQYLAEFKEGLENTSEFEHFTMEFLNSKGKTLKDLAQNVRIALTGGSVSPGIFEMIFAYAPHIDLAMTTNGYFLAAKAQALKNAGLKRLNISLDTLDNEKFRQIARRDGLKEVLGGIEAAKSAGLGIKLNTVAIKGFNDDEFDALMSFAAASPLAV